MSKQPGHPVRIAMWSGPRNISTAMMRAWGGRPDTAVWDEPLYAHYLQHTGLKHPGADEVMALDETDWRKVVRRIVGPVPDGKAIFFQKHMAHHLLDHVDTAWIDACRHAFLIRDPKEMLMSLDRVFPNPSLADTGLPQQVRVFELVQQEASSPTLRCAKDGAPGDSAPAVVDSRDVLRNPRRLLTLLTESLGVAFDERMLSWPAGRRETDGVWAKHWYAGVEQSVGFAPYRPKTEPLADHLRELHEQCMPYYETLYAHRLGR